ncbi:stage II sporulation protein M [Flammeovirgaceae bacterium SG7u.111]|nr:stage II sporulation protein M [Flammeovirgaceae bacterium SG7u.132]WPO38447.1 stage II sporulation protein M [Flammeovirgaceae bacterium SG7u.111]
MRETDFIKQNKKKWQDFEELLNQTDKKPDELTRLFIEITDDLSYSRTFYPNRLVGAYLNNVAQKIYKSVYGKRHENFKAKLKDFWFEEVPAVVYASRNEMIISLVVFLFSVFIGIFSSMHDPEFVNLILGDSYVNMTLENIENGDPMAVYKGMNEIDMFLGITINNLSVAFLTFVTGVLMSIGTLAVLLRNGIMVGAFQYFFIERGLFLDSFLTIWMHGTLEISAIVIAGAAGLTMGRGLVFPGSYSRIYSFQLSAKRGIKIMMSIFPVFVLAGFIEGFLTRYTDLPDIIRLFIILISLAFIIGYYIYYPYIKSKSGFKNKKEQPINFGRNDKKLDKGELKDNGQIFTDIFAVYRVFLRKTLLYFLPLSAVFGIYITYTTTQGFTEQFGYISSNWAFSQIETIFNYDIFFQFAIANGAMLAGSLFFCVIICKVIFGENGTIDPRFGKETIFATFKSHFVKVLFISSLITLISCLGWIGYFLLLMTYPFILLWMFESINKGKNLMSSFKNATSLLGGSLAKIIGLNIILLIICTVFLFTLNSSIVWFLVESLSINFLLSENAMNFVFNGVFSSIVMYGICLTLPILIIGNGILYHSLIELSTAQSLKKTIREFGSNKKVYGFETES